MACVQIHRLRVAVWTDTQGYTQPLPHWAIGTAVLERAGSCLRAVRVKREAAPAQDGLELHKQCVEEISRRGARLARLSGRLAGGLSGQPS